jgi:hypothetical protein
LPNTLLSAFYGAWLAFASKTYLPSPFYKGSWFVRRSAMALFDFAKAGAVRQQMASHPILPHRQRGRPRAGLGSIGTVLVLMGIGIGVLTIRFILVFAHTVLQ